jgi:hypothetical protein
VIFQYFSLSLKNKCGASHFFGRGCTLYQINLSAVTSAFT